MSGGPTVREQDKQTRELLDIARQILELTEEVSPLTAGVIIAHESRPLASGARGRASPNNTQRGDLTWPYQISSRSSRSGRSRPRNTPRKRKRSRRPSWSRR